MGGDGGKYKRRKYLRALEKLAKLHPDIFKLESSRKEMGKIIWTTGGRPYPIAANHAGISETIALELGKLLEKYGVCTKEEFISMIK